MNKNPKNLKIHTKHNTHRNLKDLKFPINLINSRKHPNNYNKDNNNR